ncbi:rhodanese-like domain-containing protein [Flavobacteriaceae bacterium]|uniref:rhodanese-like domain-containing protein n=1 Tax=Candidatus Arcticimaribacter forsetii TaxID=2820661 RepID=UPI0020775194|nr:rhodanese-like domain-containing protein [Candidatus Arcticimaribacter forsetii]MDA8699172.1 rhodanese-like domain-containing protein [Flavobacteriaceae bacterium]MDB2345480.1 rhodanese-like domain-containing protein [Flavobacteriaceae bacterium]MDB4674838.1 rhodanese-like domain-containing protein [Flavobacteriaceae bacterium]
MNDLDQNEWVSLKEETPDAVILDVRTEGEFESGYIEGAQLIDIRQPQEFMDSIQALDKTKSYFVYCRSGARSGQACQLLGQLGIESAYNLEGGILAWTGDLVE